MPSSANKTANAWDNLPGFDPVAEKYVQLDLKKWLADHGIEKEGARRGGENQPAGEEDALDAVEAQIVDWVNRRGRVCRQNVAGYLSDLERELADMEDDAELRILEDRVGELRQDAEIELERMVDAGRTALVDKEEAVSAGTAEFERFRTRERLTRLVDYSHRAKALWFVFGCAFIEVVLNASLLMDVNPFGLLGSTMQMGLISAVNVLFLGLVMGSLLRQSNHRAAVRKVASWFGIALVIAVVFAFNLAVGHFRNSMQASVDDPAADVLAMGGDVVERLLAGPLELASFQTVLLVLLGILCFAVGAWKWLQRDDAYPEYGRRHRQLGDIKEDYAQAYGVAQDGVKRKYEQFQSELLDMRHKLTVKQSAWREVCKRADHLVSDYSTNLGQYQLDLNFLLAAYRTANLAARSSSPPPHFERQEHVDEEILQPPGFQPPEETNISGVAEKVHGAIEELQTAYRAARKEHRPLEAVIKAGLDSIRATA